MNNQDHDSMFKKAAQDLVKLYQLTEWKKKIKGYYDLSYEQKEYLYKVLLTSREFLDADLGSPSNYKIEQSKLINTNNGLSIPIHEYNKDTNYLVGVGKINRGNTWRLDPEQTELLLVQDECQDLFNADADNSIPVNLGVDFKYVSYWADADASNFIFCESKKPETDGFGTAEQVVNDLLKERVKSFIHTKKNKKADYKNNKYENKAKKAELSPLLKNLIKNIK